MPCPFGYAALVSHFDSGQAKHLTHVWAKYRLPGVAVRTRGDVGQPHEDAKNLWPQKVYRVLVRNLWGAVVGASVGTCGPYLSRVRQFAPDCVSLPVVHRAFWLQLCSVRVRPQSSL
jgi:hypothetical protein